MVVLWIVGILLVMALIGAFIGGFSSQKFYMNQNEKYKRDRKDDK